MKKGFSFVELIVCVGIISLISGLTFFVIRASKTSYADPYETIRVTISDAANVFLNSNVGTDFKDDLYLNKKVKLNTNLLIDEGLLDESYYNDNLGVEQNIKNIEIIVFLDEEGFLEYSINIV